MDQDLPSLKEMKEMHSLNVTWALHQEKMLKSTTVGPRGWLSGHSA